MGITFAADTLDVYHTMHLSFVKSKKCAHPLKSARKFWVFNTVSFKSRTQPIGFDIFACNSRCNLMLLNF